MTSIKNLLSELKDSGLYTQALTHKSYHHENLEESCGHNERLEFLGDAVVDLVLSEMLMKHYPEVAEGTLSKLRASLVNEEVLSKIALEQSIDKDLRLGKGELASNGRTKPRVLASALEALVGALYWELGYDKSKQFVEAVFVERVTELDPSQEYWADYKTRLQEVCQEKFKVIPVYEMVEESGPDHDKSFKSEVSINGEVKGRGEGRSKKMAEQNAAARALKELS